MKTFIVLFLAIILSACDDSQMLQEQNKYLQAKVSELQEKINNNYAEATARNELMEKQAQIYQACVFFSDFICPSSMKQPGRKAVEEGYSGGGSYFWLLLALQLFALTSFLGSAAAFSSLVITKITAPSAEKIEEAKRTIKTANDQVELAQKKIEQHEKNIKNLKQQEQEQEQELKKLAQEIYKKTTQLKSLEETIRQKQEQLKMAQSAKSAFDGIG